MTDDSTALQKVEQLGSAALARIEDNTLDALVGAFSQLPFDPKFESWNSENFVFDRATITVDGITVSYDINPRLPNKTLFGAICYMKTGNFKYAEILLNRSLGFSNRKTKREKVNENDRRLLSCLVLAQYARGKYSKAINSALRLYESDHRKVARKLVARIAAKLDGEIGKVEQQIRTPLYDGFVRMSEGTKSGLLRERDVLLEQRAYAGRVLNYMKGNQFLSEVKEMTSTAVRK